MNVTVVATLCRIAAATVQPDCVEEVITDEATLMQCGGGLAQAAIADWIGHHPRYVIGWRLAKWGCAIGYQRKRDA